MMKKITLFFALLFCMTLFTNAQNSGTRIWYEDFDSVRFKNGFPEGWIVRDNLGQDLNWVWSLQGPRGRYTSPNGAFGGDSAFVHSEPIQSTTSGNGFMMLEADYFNTDNEGQQADELIYLDSYFITPAIDLSDYTGAVLRVQQYFRYSGYENTTDISVFVSSDFDPNDLDSGTWTEYSLKEGVQASHYSDDPDIRDVNISTAAGGKSEVYLKFHFYNSAQYFWMLDDIEILEPFNNDLIMDYFWADYGQEPDAVTTDSLDNWYGGYTFIPESFVQEFVSFRAAFSSMGYITQSNTRLNVNITKDGSEVFDEDSDPINIAFFESKNVTLETDFSPSEVGHYQVSATILSDNSDSYPSNNHAVMEFHVNDTVYARATNEPSNYTFISTSMLGGGSDGNNLCIVVDIPSGDYATNFTSISTYIHPLIDEDNVSFGNASMTARVYEYNNSTNTFDIAPYMSSENYELQVSDIGNFVTLPLIDEGNGSAQPGTYAVGIEFFMSGSDRNFFIGNDLSVDQPQESAFAFIGTEWEEIDHNPVIMLNVETITGIENTATANNFKLEQNYPNPFEGTTEIQYQVNQANNVLFEVYDITGKLVISKDLGMKNSGSYNLTLNASKLDRGIYMYRLLVGEESQTRRMIVK